MKRPFEIIDRHGHKRYHCKASHSYKLPKAFTEDAIAKRIHLCKDEMEKLEARQALEADAEMEGARSDRITRPPPSFAARAPRSRAASSAAGQPPPELPPTLGGEPDDFRHVQIPNRVNGVVPSN